jgi:hypothetical protein
MDGHFAALLTMTILAVRIQSEDGPCGPRTASSNGGSEAAHGAHGPPFAFHSVEEEKARLNF